MTSVSEVFLGEGDESKGGNNNSVQETIHSDTTRVPQRSLWVESKNQGRGGGTCRGRTGHRQGSSPERCPIGISLVWTFFGLVKPTYY